MQWNSFYKEKISDIIFLAKKNTDFYANRLASVEEQNLTSDMFNSIPILHKSEFIGKEEMLLSKVIPKEELCVELTSGTTGNSLKCYMSQKESALKAMDLWKLRQKRSGISPRDRRVVFSCYYHFAEKKGPIYEIDNELWLSVLDMSPGMLNEYAKAIKDFKPSWINSVPSALHIFASHVNDTGQYMGNIGIKYIESVGEMMFNYQQKSIEKAFGPVVYNMYGSRENWCIALSCNEGNLHLLDHRFFVEIINTNEDGIGELVVTDLYNKTWPLIRYKLGDLVQEELITCKCGDKQPVLRVTGGRTQEYLKIGEWIGNPIVFHFAVTGINEDYGDCIRQHQLIQETETQLKMKIVVGPDFHGDILTLLHKELAEVLPSSASLSIINVDSISYSGNKFRWFIPYTK